MRILSITAQKPDSTGSGVFLTELIKSFHGLNCTQAVICGGTEADDFLFPEGVQVYPVRYQTEQLPFPVCGMSDEMPYVSTRYRDMDEKMTAQMLEAFGGMLARAVEEFHPDVILCHHLYFVASLTRQRYPEIPVFGQCHGSDLRQIETNGWQRQWIKDQIPKLDGIFALHEAQKEQICRIFGLGEERVQVVGTGFNSSVFFHHGERVPGEKKRYLFAGKISEKKGVCSLLRCLSRLACPEKTELYLAGGCGSEAELAQFRELAKEAPCEVHFLGKLDQKELVRNMNESDVFILPSFYEGLPLVLIEAMACGMRTICTDLPGIQPWLNQAVPGNGTVFVTPPRMHHADEPDLADLPDFEARLAEAMEMVFRQPEPDPRAVAHLSWEALCRKLLSIFDNGR